MKYLGIIDRSEVNKLYGCARVGLVLYQPAANHVNAQPIKMFEYMAAGLPSVVSNFPLWMELVGENACGICVDPTSPQAVHEAIQYLLEHPVEAQTMGRNGRKNVMEKYNWGVEEKKLLALYQDILEEKAQ